MNYKEYWKKDSLRNITAGGLACPEGFDVLAFVRKSIEVCGPDTDKLLDLGCGIGRLSEIVPKANYIGADLNPNALATASERHPDRQYVEVDVVGALPEADVCLAYTVFLHVDDDTFRKTVERLKLSGNKYIIICEVMGRAWRRGGNPPVFNREVYEYCSIMADLGYKLKGSDKKIYERYRNHAPAKDPNLHALVFEKITKSHKTTNRKKIPKKLHYIWIGPEMPGGGKKLIEESKKILKGWDVKVWDEPPANMPAKYRELFNSCDLYCQKADIMRYWICYTEGGFYMDVDTILLKDLDPLRGCEAIAGHQPDGRVTNGVIGCVKKSPTMIHLLDSCILRKGRKDRAKFGPGMITEEIGSLVELGMDIKHSHFFYPSGNRMICYGYLHGNAQFRERWLNGINTPDGDTPYTIPLWGMGDSSEALMPESERTKHQTVPITHNPDIYHEYLKGKRVAVVGPAGYLKGRGLGDLIDSYDVVVRINNDYKVSAEGSKDSGSKIDVLYSSMFLKDAATGNIPVVQPEVVDNSIYIVAAMPYLRGFRKHINIFRKKAAAVGRDYVPAAADEHYETFRLSTGARPTSGAMTIMDIIDSEASEVFITGFTFLNNVGESMYLSSYREDRKGVWTKEDGYLVATQHVSSAELTYMSRKIKQSSKTTTDNYLDTIMEEALIRENNPMDTYYIKPGYTPRKNIKFFATVGQKNIESWQIPVYNKAAELSPKGLIMDIGCGAAGKLISHFENTCGVDLDPTISSLKKKYPDREWQLSDFNDPERYSGRYFDVVICGDIIEHLMDPNEMLRFISKIEFGKLIISTPDRRTLKSGKNGPPNNKHHVREWSHPELLQYLRCFFKITEESVYKEHWYKASMVVCEKYPKASLVLSWWKFPVDRLNRFIESNDKLIKRYDAELVVVCDKKPEGVFPKYIKWAVMPKDSTIFSITRASNLGIRSASNDIIIKTDVDMFFTADDWEKLIDVKKGHALVATVRRLRKYAKEIDISSSSPWKGAGGGGLAMHKDDWHTCKGYCEYMEGYCPDDKEMLFYINGHPDIELHRDPDLIAYHMPHKKRNKNNPYIRSPIKNNIYRKELHRIGDDWGKGKVLEPYTDPPERQQYIKFMRGKRVAIVGPAGYLEGSGMGKNIDSFDVIVRVNNALPLPKKLYKDIGSRTDVLYTSCYYGDATACNRVVLNPKLGKDCKFIASAYPAARGYKAQVNKFFKDCAAKGVGITVPYPDFQYIYLKVEVGGGHKRPTTGLSAIYDIIQMKPKELLITGFTSCISTVGDKAYVKGYRSTQGQSWKSANKTMNSLAHSTLAERKMILELVNGNKHVHFDKIFEEALKKEGNNE